MHYTYLLIFLFFSLSLNAQNYNYWIGGFPGKEHQWNCPSNWSTNKVPDAQTDVVIGKCYKKGVFHPIVSELVRIKSLKILDNATLVIGYEGLIMINNNRHAGIVNLGKIIRINAVHLIGEKVANVGEHNQKANKPVGNELATAQ